VLCVVTCHESRVTHPHHASQRALATRDSWFVMCPTKVQYQQIERALNNVLEIDDTTRRKALHVKLKDEQQAQCRHLIL